jgi:hypothetical protein
MPSFNLTIQPAQLELVVQPGATFTQAYQITNNSDNSLILTSSVLPWTPLGTLGNLTYDQVPDNPYFQFTLGNADLRLGQTFVLPPRASRQLVLKVTSLSQTPLQDSYFTFFISQENSDSLHLEDTQTASVARIGSHLLISSSPTENPSVQAKITSFSLHPRLKDIFFPKLRFEAQVTNQSGYFFKTSGKITVTKNNLVFTKLDLFPQNVLAQSSRSLSCNLDDQQPVDCTLTPPFWPGKYTAVLSLDASASSASATLNFYVFPYTLLFIITALVAIFLSVRSRH